MTNDTHTHPTQHTPHWPGRGPRLLVPLQKAHPLTQPFTSPRQNQPAQHKPEAQPATRPRPINRQPDSTPCERTQAKGNFEYLLDQIEHLNWPVPDRAWIEEYQATLCRIFGEFSGHLMMSLLRIVIRCAQAKQARMN